MPRRSVLPSLALFVVVTTGCGGQNDDPEGANQLFVKVSQGAGYARWARAPGYAERRPSFTAHADAVEIFVNDVMSQALAGAVPLTTRDRLIPLWPVGSIVVKDGYRGDDRSLTAIMEKRQDGWFFAEYDGDGDPLYSGRPSICLQCHDNRADYSDWIYAFEFPR